jgi:hypothetical protein
MAGMAGMAGMERDEEKMSVLSQNFFIPLIFPHLPV